MPTTAYPTISPPPTSTPTKTPEKPIKGEINVVVTLKNTLNRNMTATEEQAFQKDLLTFFNRLTLENEGAIIEGIEVWYQEQVEWGTRRSLRKLQQPLTSTAITLILQLTYFESNPDISNAIVTYFEEASTSIINLFRGNDAYPIFYQIDQLQARAIEQVTLSPMAAPTPTAEVEHRSADKQGGTSGTSAGGTLFPLFNCA